MAGTLGTVRFAASVVAFALAATACGDGGADGGGDAANGGELSALVWCDHTDPELLRPFEEEHGVRVNVRDYEGTGVALGILEQSQPGDWDVFVIDSVDVPRVAEAGLLAELDRDDFPWEDFFEAVRMPDIHELDGTLYAVPEKFGYNTIAFDGDAVDESVVEDLSALWDPELEGRIAIYDYYIPVMELVALELGIEPDQITMDDLPAIEERLLELREQSALTGDVVQVQTALATGEVDVIVGGGEYVTSVLNEENPELDWILPEQGGIRWQQAIGVLADSEQQDLATEFVRYIVSEEGQARLATSSCYWGMPANSQAALSDEEKDILRWDQQDDYIANSYPYYIPDEELDAAMLDVWTRFLQS
ncbi:ABC transporter substrate-binding protein [Nitriliruptor alkaliphilus]|uniref:ABC transporter substrate-binding protein n=1 Tax=Nitriliruptor alkaliphilus TaxID=427918 RepID=UPI0009F96EFF|nr:extracellular solute-binding protein [Nitriliruptor alkaliphilus]